MRNLDKAGGVAALVEAFAYIVGFSVMATLLNPANAADWSPAQKLSFVLERKAIFQMWTLLIYVVFGVALVVLAVALHERLRARAADLMQIATAFGLIWAGLVIASGMVASIGLNAVAALHATDVAQAGALWKAVSTIQDGLGGGVEIVGGLWVLLISIASLRSMALPRVLGFLGLIVGVSDVLTIVPSLGELGAIFGLGQIPWFVWIGVILLRPVDDPADRTWALPNIAAVK